MRPPRSSIAALALVGAVELCVESDRELRAGMPREALHGPGVGARPDRLLHLGDVPVGRRFGTSSASSSLEPARVAPRIPRPGGRSEPSFQAAVVSLAGGSRLERTRMIRRVPIEALILDPANAPTHGGEDLAA